MNTPALNDHATLGTFKGSPDGEKIANKSVARIMCIAPKAGRISLMDLKE